MQLKDPLPLPMLQTDLSVRSAKSVLGANGMAHLRSRLLYKIRDRSLHIHLGDLGSKVFQKGHTAGA